MVRKIYRNNLRKHQVINEQEKQIGRKDLISRIINSDTLLIALTPIISYSLLYIYKVGQSSALNIPTFIVNFSLGEIFAVAFALILFGSVLLLYLNKFLKPFLGGRISEPVFSIIYPSFFVYGYFLLLLFIYSGLNDESLIILIATLFYSFRYLKPLFSKVKGNYVEKLIAQEGKAHKVDDTDLFDVIIPAIGRKVYRFILFYILLMIVVFNLGRSLTLKKMDYIVASSAPECVVLASNDQYSYCYFFNRDNKEVQQEFMIINSSDINKYIFTNQNIGPLKLARIPTPTNEPTIIPIVTLTLTPTLSRTVQPTSTQLVVTPTSITRTLIQTVVP